MADSSKVSNKLINEWVKDIDNWDLSDQLVTNLLWRIDELYKKAIEMCLRKDEFSRRIGFALMAKLAMSNKKASDYSFIKFSLISLKV